MLTFILFYFFPDDNLRFRQGDVYSLLSPLLKDCVRVLNASSLVIVKSAKLLRLVLKLIIVLLHACFCASHMHPSGISFVLPSGGFVLSQYRNFGASLIFLFLPQCLEAPFLGKSNCCFYRYPKTKKTQTNRLFFISNFHAAPKYSINLIK